MIKYNNNSPLPNGVVQIARGLFRTIIKGVDAKRTGVVSYNIQRGIGASAKKGRCVAYD